MATNDDMEAFLQVMANLHTLSAPNTAQSVTSELLALRKRDRENCTIINRLSEDNAKFMQQSKAAADEHHMLDKSVKTLQEKLSRAKADSAEFERLAEKRGEMFRQASAKVTRLEQYRVELKPGSKDEVGTRWSELWTVVNQLATAFFSEDLDPKALLEAHGFTTSTSHQYQRDFPCPATNTNEAKQMRVIAVSSIIATALSRHVFRPIGMDSSLAMAVSKLSGTNPDMESFYRASHLAALESMDEYTLPLATRAVKAAVTEVLSSVSHILPPASVQKFQTNLEFVCKRADREWQVFQRYEERYEVDMDGDKSSYDHAPLWKPSKESTPKSNGTVETPALGAVQNDRRAGKHAEVRTSAAAIVTTVWPHLKVVGTTGADADPGISGLALFTDQTRRVEEQVKRESRKASREESKQDDRKSGKRPASLGAFLQSSQKIAQERVTGGENMDWYHGRGT